MNKTIIINISGVIFHIEEDAYEMLKTYMTDIKAHFASFKDNFEIITDIENRIAEMLAEVLASENKQVIIADDVKLVISKMGNPSEFESEDEEYKTEESSHQSFRRKLFRDIDDRILGGVCSGIGHYFDIEARWIRVAFILLFMFYGFGLLPYLLLWVVMPKAKTRSEKMEMKGEKINLQSFQKNFEEELNAVGSRLSDVHQQAIPGLNRIGSFLRDLVDGLMRFLGTTGKLLLKLFGFIIIAFVGIGLVCAFIALLIFLGYAGNTDVSTIFPLNAVNASLRPAIYIAAFFVIFIPLLGIIFLVIRVLFNNRTIGKSIGFSLLMVWIIALAVGIFTISKNATDFKEEASFSESIALKANDSKVYYLKIGSERTIQENFVGGNDSSDKIITITGNDRDFDTPNKIDLRLNLVNDNNLSVIKTYTARGKNIKEALKNAQQLEYYYSQKDSLLSFDYSLGLKDGSLWRAQEVDLKLNIPVGSTLYVQKRFIDHFLRNQMYDCSDWSDESDTYVKVQATKDGFICQKTADAIERQKNYNKNNNIESEVKENIVF
ncbi:MAG: PspC domain-containing protein [Bacteroidetes bacterium]|nr:PspC domain-containing protein [Bacteroidota bacterium]MBU1373895.1 PspC domain-containing protein [Bacteroidota bacterium]MBU1485500.1 PspC domain-containing protein [Bacteroidota bacterium]MBU1761119.1 PspC domain-containing protein [Bacteroidota bacterium]MBU2045361.1 PspC domain-containing protein [Bacteroidota bacterium]